MDKQEVVVVDVQMPFWSMVTFMVTWSVATIPAMVILFFAGLFLTFFFNLFFG
ncbi:MAG: hypothetical protein IID08_07175 [Candidatus Hydrogenedentes bacterium]|nr:hypothetical protein [Candidatus Hydrogenedentota bacterium]